MSQNASEGSPVFPPPDTPDTRLSGRWLALARVGWVALTLPLLTLNLVMIPRFYGMLQAPCQPGATCYGFLLTSADQQLLRRMGLSLGLLTWYQVGLDVVSVLVYCALGALLLWRKAADRMALFCAYMLVLFGGVAFTEIIQATLAAASPVWFVLIGILQALGQASFIIFFFLFPSGRFVPRWTRWLTLLVVGYWIVGVFFSSSASQNGDTPDNLVLFGLLLCAVGTQVYRFRRVSTPREREQTKWVVFGFAIGIIGFVLFIGVGSLLPSPGASSAEIVTVIGQTSLYAFLLLIPVSIVVAILRSRLWDIDTIINRTLVYGSLTALLGALYAGLIVGLESLAGLLGGVTAHDSVVLVISTLAIAGLFLPARRRMQNIIDRRFYRKKYDAEKTLLAFSTTLRNEVDLEELREHLLAIVQETMQLEHVSLWLRQPEQHLTDRAHRLQPTGPTSIESSHN